MFSAVLKQHWRQAGRQPDGLAPLAGWLVGCLAIDTQPDILSWALLSLASAKKACPEKERTYTHAHTHTYTNMYHMCTQTERNTHLCECTHMHTHIHCPQSLNLILNTGDHSLLPVHTELINAGKVRRPDKRQWIQDSKLHNMRMVTIKTGYVLNVRICKIKDTGRRE